MRKEELKKHELFTVFLQWQRERERTWCAHSLTKYRKRWPDTLWECKPMLDFNKIRLMNCFWRWSNGFELVCCYFCCPIFHFVFVCKMYISHSHFVSVSHLFTFQKQILFGEHVKEKQSEIPFECSIENRADFYLEIFSSTDEFFFLSHQNVYSFQWHRLYNWMLIPRRIICSFHSIF